MENEKVYYKISVDKEFNGGELTEKQTDVLHDNDFVDAAENGIYAVYYEKKEGENLLELLHSITNDLREYELEVAITKIKYNPNTKLEYVYKWQD